ncbi:MAG: M48 family metallopeptidase [Desulfuromonadales bacterium]|nr:M48 family metallopeptidase [Desulfuromonadales bacterium]
MNKTVVAIKVVVAGLFLVAVTGCLELAGSHADSASAPRPTGTATGGKVDAAQVERLERLMLPLLRVMDRPISSNQVQIEVVDEPQINAGSAGSGQFIVTTGLLRQANDVHLEAILAHEIAHDDLGHVAKAQALGAGLSIATVLLDQFFPGSGQLAPIAGNLAIRAYGRNEEYAADMHGVVLLRRIHANGKERMVDTMTWLQQTAGNSGGGFFATHPATDDRIDRIRKIP